MRDYSKVSPRFWTGETGKAIRSMGPEVQVVAFYLFTCPSANMLGLYYLPLPTLCHETGRPLQGALKALRRLSEGGFAAYDERSEHVFVPEMARHQIGERLSKKDNRHKAVLKELENLRKSPFFNDFLSKYRDAFQLHEVEPNDVSASPSEGPSEPLRSQKQEQEQKKATAAFALPDWIPAEPWAAWIEVRAKQGAPNTTRALRLAVKELARLKASGQDPQAVLEQATLRGWRGIFPVKGGAPAPGELKLAI